MTFVVVVSGIIFLIIFFGAWAVSADTSGGERKLTFSFTSSAATVNNTSANSSGTNSQESLDQESAKDSWWGGAFLKACPFH
ncbi:MAG: hypothetical protein BZY81_01785 [SAR202 cluster bacterium Io17-Chloro-G4]|nr:MAG: hypothetical protein BZY81_01785 [SAR202 cluster bacterium Io17-Chloro-G4]